MARDSASSSHRPRPHVCRVCRKAFVRAEHLRRHIASHENLRHFSCQACSASFTRADVLQRHIKKCDEYSQMSRQSPRNQQDAEARPAGHEGAETRAADLPDTEDLTVTVAADAGHIQTTGDSTSRGPPQVQTPSASPSSPGQARSAPDFEQVTNDHAPSFQPARQRRSTASTQLSQSPGYQAFNLQPQPAFPLAPQDAGPGDVLAKSSAALNSLPDMMATDQIAPRLSIMPGSSDIFGHMPSLVLDDLAFLEDSLLPDFDFNPMGFHHRQLLERTRLQQQSQIQHLSPDNEEILLSRTRNVTPAPSQNDSPTGAADSRPNYRPWRGLRCIQEDAEMVNAAFASVCGLDSQVRGNFPSRSRLTRFLNAYFEYFDQHTPIIHHPSFSASSTHPGLILAMLALGGSYLSENDLAHQSYEASCRLVAKYESEPSQESGFALWPIQASLLCAQYGAFADNIQYFRRAQRHITLVSDLLSSAEELYKSSPSPDYDWSQWILTESLSRLTCWTYVMDAVIVCYDPTATCHFVRREASILSLPSSNNLWRAPSAAEWAAIKESETQSFVNINTAVDMILHAKSIPEPVSSLSLMALLGSMLSTICMMEKFSIFTSGLIDNDSITRIEQSLHTWEILWRKHPHAETIPSRYGDCLMVDSLALLSSAYFHLYLGPELRHIKHLAANPETPVSWLRYRSHPRVLRAVKYAASSWLVRSKLGVAHLKRVAALLFGGHVLVTSYETALVLSWWLSIRHSVGYQFVPDGEDADCLQRLDELFREIYEEISDQGICCDILEEPGRLPLMFYHLFMHHRWVWTYSTTMAENLRSLELRLGGMSQAGYSAMTP